MPRHFSEHIHTCSSSSTSGRLLEATTRALNNSEGVLDWLYHDFKGFKMAVKG